MCWLQISKRILIAVLFSATVLPLSALAQPRGAVVVESNLDEALVYVDSLRLGRVGHQIYRVASGRRHLRVAPPAVLDWSVAPIDTVVDVAAADTLHLRLLFPYHYRIETVPFGATVLLEEEGGRRSLGRAPVRYVSRQPLSGTMVIDEPGYVIERFSPGQDVWNVHRITLEPTEPAVTASERIAWQPPEQQRWWIDATALGLAAAATVVSVHYKFKADRLEEARERDCSGEAFGPRCAPRVADQIHEYDRIAAWSLGAAQVGVGVFALRLILR